MTRIMISVFFVFLQSLLFAQDGVHFRDLGFEEGLKAARTENKLVFIDCYTSWCVPCRMMVTQVFPQKEAGDFFNSRFVCLKFNMEKGEGPVLARRFNVQAYPTFLMVRPDGTEQYRVVGGSDLNSFIEKVRKGFDEKKTYPYLNAGYRAGKLDKGQMLDYYLLLLSLYKAEEARKVHEELSAMLTAADKVSAAYWPYFKKLDFGSDDYVFVMEHTGELKKNIGAGVVEDFLDGLHTNALYSFFYNGFTPDIPRLGKALEKLQTAYRPSFEAMFHMVEAYWNKDLDLAVAILDRHMSSLRMPEVRLAFSVLQNMRAGADAGQVRKMCGSLEKMISIQRNREGVAYMKRWLESNR